MSGARSKTAARSPHKARIELLRYVDEVLAQAPERAGRLQAGRWALRWLQTNRRSHVLGEAPVRQSPTDLAKIAEEQADRMGLVLDAILDGLGLSAEQYERGCTIAYEALRAQTVEGWEPL